MQYENLSGLMFNLLNQSKTIFTALFVYLLLGRKSSRVQIVGLLLIFAAAVVLSIPVDDGSSSVDDFWTGIVPILAASMLSGIASSLGQRTLQAQGRHAQLFSLELSVFCSLVLIIGLFVSGNVKSVYEKGFFYGWNVFTCIPVLTQSLGGLCVGKVTQLLGGVQKGFGIIFGIIITGFSEAIFYRQFPAPRLWFGLIFVICGSSLYILNTPKQQPGKKEKKR